MADDIEIVLAPDFITHIDVSAQQSLLAGDPPDGEAIARQVPGVARVANTVAVEQ